jgi:hypothetical protein
MSRVELGMRMTELYPRIRPAIGKNYIIGEVEDATPGYFPGSLLVTQIRPHGYQVDTLNEARARFSDMRGVAGDWLGYPDEPHDSHDDPP